MKTFTLILLVLTATLVRAQNPSVTVTEAVKMEIARGKGSVLLSAGTVVEVVGKEGDNLGIIYRSVRGTVPAAKTNYRGEPLPASAATESPTTKAAVVAAAPAPAVTAKPADAKPIDKSAPGKMPDAPVSLPGRMVQKARDNEAAHRENLVQPADSAVSK